MLASWIAGAGVNSSRFRGGRKCASGSPHGAFPGGYTYAGNAGPRNVFSSGGKYLVVSFLQFYRSIEGVFLPLSFGGATPFSYHSGRLTFVLQLFVGIGAGQST